MIRITGIVKTANQVRNKLQQGIDPQEADSFKAFVDNSLDTIEKICRKAKTTPNSLPAPSRKAYNYLKRIDWHNLPQIQSKQASPPIQTLRIKNVVKQQQNIQRQISQVTPNKIASNIDNIAKILSNCTQDIEKICQQHQLTPAALTTPSRKAYAWMKFLGNHNNLKLHLETIGRIKALAHKTITKQKLEIPEIFVEITNCNRLYKYKKDHLGNIELQLSQGFIQADEPILQAMISMVLLGENPQAKQLVRNFGLTEEYSEIILELDLIADINAEKPQGQYYDLDLLFERINQEYFAGNMAKPRLTWNQILTQRKLGHYEPLRDRVVMSCTLDNDQVPQYVVELVLYHELLHKYHGVKWVNGKRMAHTPEFRRSERKFAYYQEAEQWLKRAPVLFM
ncbi:MAG: topoisomerase II [Xenococcus sp. (in: cyanobacteria)]